jgi:hypothetical protein
MTRDEAIEKFSHTRMHMFGERRAENWIEMFEALGMLKLDEPKDVHGDFILRLVREGVLGSNEIAYVRDCLKELNLKIVEK